MNTSTHGSNVNMNFKRKKKKSGWTPIGVAALVLGFMAAFPIGLAVLAYILWGGRVDDLISDAVDALKNAFNNGSHSPASSSGNAAFDEYKAATLRDLEQQQAEFADYVDQLRKTRDREEFEHFIKSRKKGK